MRESVAKPTEVVMALAGCLLWATTAVGLVAQEKPEEAEPAERVAEDAESTEVVFTHHRVDLGIERVGRTDQNITTIGLGYTWAPGEHHSVNITTRFVDPEGLELPEEHKGFTFSDTVVYYSWSGDYKIEAKPWLPNRFGSGVGLVIPTGDARKGAGIDMWVVTPYLGLVRAVAKRLVIAPTLSFSQSFAEGDLAVPIQAPGAEIGFLYEISPKWWLFYRPTLMYDFELEETIFLNLLQLGRHVGKRHGVSLEYGSVSDQVYSQAIGFRSNFNYRLTLQAHLGFR